MQCGLLRLTLSESLQQTGCGIPGFSAFPNLNTSEFIHFICATLASCVIFAIRHQLCRENRLNTKEPQPSLCLLHSLELTASSSWNPSLYGSEALEQEPCIIGERINPPCNLPIFSSPYYPITATTREQSFSTSLNIAKLPITYIWRRIKSRPFDQQQWY